MFYFHKICKIQEINYQNLKTSYIGIYFAIDKTVYKHKTGRAERTFYTYVYRMVIYTHVHKTETSNSGVAFYSRRIVFKRYEKDQQYIYFTNHVDTLYNL